MRHIGVDLGGTKIEAVLADGAYRVLARRRVPTPRGDGAGAYGRIVSAVASLVEWCGAGAGAGGGASGADDATVGICAPGSLAPGSDTVANSNTRCLAGRPLGRDMEAAVGRPVRIENDANCFALAEASMGAGRGCRTVFGAIMGTGVGGGLVIGGSIHGGRTNAAGEWGHHTLHPGGRLCCCGRRGCAEAYLSGPALESRWAELAAAAGAPGGGRMPGPGAPLAEVSAALGRTLPGRLPPHARQWRGELVWNFAAGISNVANILDPDAVVLGGGVSNMPLLYGAGVRAVHGRLLAAGAPGRPPPRRRTPVLPNELGDSAGAIGACML